MTVGFIGLGAMGTGMALNLLKYLHEKKIIMKVYNRTASKCGELVAAGATAVANIEDLVQDCDVVFSMTFDDKSLRETFAKVAAAVRKPNLIFVDCSTVHPSTTKQLAHDANGHNFGYLACPVFGRPDAARAKNLICVLAGEPSLKDTVRPYLEAIGKRIMDVGDKPELAHVLKLCGNFLIAGNLSLVAECLTLGEKNGQSKKNLLDLIQWFYSSPIVPGYASRMAAEDYQPGFAVPGGLKDVNLMRSLGKESGVNLEVANVTASYLQHQIDQGRSELDWGSLIMAVKDSSSASSSLQ
ncbi:hypothetical protein HK102_007790 [Quaeritorhiza haematococci]|nr:hypothetical protein HK102_007790 [Quaeritorhiza haematococci]